MPHKYTPEQVDFLIENYKGRSNAELTEMFNTHFGLNLSSSQIKRFKGNRHLNSGLTGRFKKGHATWNKGMKGLSTGGEATHFKKGHTPANYRPVGSERISVDGYIETKVADPNVWEHKHRVIWEQVNGPIPEGHVLVFGDGNRQNIDLDNLILVTRNQLKILNQKNLIQDNADLTRIGVVIADIHQKIGERKKVAN